jgi:hypothetical protein
MIGFSGATPPQEPQNPLWADLDSLVSDELARRAESADVLRYVNRAVGDVSRESDTGNGNTELSVLDTLARQALPLAVILQFNQETFLRNPVAAAGSFRLKEARAGNLLVGMALNHRRLRSTRMAMEPDSLATALPAAIALNEDRDTRRTARNNLTREDSRGDCPPLGQLWKAVQRICVSRAGIIGGVEASEIQVSKVAAFHAGALPLVFATALAAGIDLSKPVNK